MTNSTNESSNTETTESHTAHKPAPAHARKTHDAAADENKWVARFEEILKVKNADELKAELSKLAGEIQHEIQSFDLNAHLSPTAKSRIKSLEKKYNDVIKAVAKTQKQMDRELNKGLRLLKKTRLDAEKQLLDIKAKISKHRNTLVKASGQFTKKFKKATAKKRTTVKGKGAARKTKKAAK